MERPGFPTQDKFLSGSGKSDSKGSHRLPSLPQTSAHPNSTISYSFLWLNFAFSLPVFSFFPFIKSNYL